ncbi:hypothetical protein CJU89_0378 [Yarrowia sp. B02]|nr:hypothetical protein CJU89_0378 [Yarrowia sp. B02]
MDEFLTVHMAAIMEKMTLEEFEKYTSGFITQVSKPPTSLMTQAGLVWSRLCNSWSYNRDVDAVELAKTVSLEDMKQFYNELFDTEKRSLCLEINSIKDSKRYELEKEKAKKEDHISANI